MAQPRFDVTQRATDQTEASGSHLEALKLRGLAERWEALPARTGLSGLDSALLAHAKSGSGLEALSGEEYLLRRKLADRRGSGIVLRRAAELLFAKADPEHPNVGIRVFRATGTERRPGLEPNVEETRRIDGNLPAVIHGAFAAVKHMIRRRPSRVGGGRLRNVPECPEYAWSQAVLNAVAHRDYSVKGRSTEIWLFEDKLEVTNPGGLSPDLTLHELLSLERRHASRNPRLARVLVDLGMMREQGEGIPRMFSEMKCLLLPPPIIEARRREFSVTLETRQALSNE